MAVLTQDQLDPLDRSVRWWWSCGRCGEMFSAESDREIAVFKDWHLPLCPLG